MMNLSSSGRALYSMLVIIELIQTLLPEPVEPAINRWGIVARSTHIVSPAAVLPSAIANGESIEANFSEFIAERRNTI